ncbi:MAG: triose-phosphate isomerase [Bdellovibrionales bacterium]|nr:triose-phosphate isomerase [Bdellovibrionales bacterium]
MIYVGNWKMNQSFEGAQKFLQSLKKRVSEEKQKSYIILSPAVLFGLMKDEFSGTNFNWGGQNCFYKNEGPYTGENSPQLMYEMGARYVLVGHSERRLLFGETHEMILEKAHIIVQNKMTPILCVGESLEQRSQFQNVLKSQLTGFSNISPLMVAYEPVWAIGSGKIPNNLQIQSALSVIKEAVPQSTVLYGGSVNSQVFRTLLCKELEGFLIGKASLNVDSFILE